MDLCKYAEKIPFEFFIIRKYVCTLLPHNQIEVSDKKFLYPLENFNKTSLSLTEQVDVDNQIRFFLKERVF